MADSRMTAAEPLRWQELERIEPYLDAAGTLIVVLDGRGRVVRANGPSCELLGWSNEELLGHDWFGVAVARADRGAARDAFTRLLAGDIPALDQELAMRTKGGPECVIAWRTTALPGHAEEVAGILLSGLDVTDRTRTEAQIAYLAYHDRLTGLPNWALMREHLELALARARERGKHVALLSIDLDDFRLVNESLGHAVGDQVIQRAAARLRRLAGADQLLARQGGDEFLLLLTDLEEPDTAAAAMASRVMSTLEEPFTMTDTEFQLGASVGASVFPGDAGGADGLQKHADAAMYEAKRPGEGNFALYAAGGTSIALERLSITTRLRRALAQEELLLHYQPIIDLADGSIVAVEALIRWQDPRRGLLAPVDFIPAAEENGMIEEIGQWVVEAACRQAQEWGAAGLEPRISFNVSPRELSRPGFAEHIAAQLAAHGLDPATFTVEVTESTTMREPGLAESILSDLSRLGLRLAIDDFGTGYSSLSRLRQMPVQLLKIDGSFLRGAPEGRDAAKILEAAINLVNALGMVAVAEGVETEPQRRFLAEHGCSLAQGFHLGRPLPVAEMSALLRGEGPG